MTRITTLLAVMLVAGIAQVAAAQGEPVQLTTATARAKQTLGLIVYSAGGQTAEQQARDEQAMGGPSSRWTPFPADRAPIRPRGYTVQ